MRVFQDWHQALECARLGDLAPANAARQAETPSAAADYFFARCLTEAPAIQEGQYAEAYKLLETAVATQPSNPLFTQTMLLALARSPSEESRYQAASLWRRYGLTHDLDLLGQTALTFEMQLRPLPESPRSRDLPWPTSVPRPEGSIGMDPAPIESEIVAALPTNESDKMSQSDAPKEPIDLLPGGLTEIPLHPLSPIAPFANSREPELPSLTKAKGPSGKTLQRLESALLRHESLPVIEETTALLEQGLGGIELHLLAGLAAEEEGDAPRARAHLARAVRIDPSLLVVRSELARIYWRLDWFDLALALWRSLPVEGPFDYGRHYHLALAHEALGDRKGAVLSMRLALNDFYYDVRHFYIKRIWDRWLDKHGPAAKDLDKRSGPVPAMIS